MLRTREESFPEERREFMKFVNFVLTNPVTLAYTKSQGFAPFPSRIVNLVLAKLENVSCGVPPNNYPCIRPQLVPQHTSPAFVAMYVLAAVGAAMVLSILVFYLFNPGEELSFSEILYLITFSLGILIGYLSVFFWAASPNNSSICQARQWLSPLGIAITLSALSSRIFQIVMIYKSPLLLFSFFILFSFCSINFISFQFNFISFPLI